MLVVMSKSEYGCSTLLFVAIDFWRVILSEDNLDFVKRAPIADLKQ